MATYVPGKVVTIRDKGFVQRKWQPAHYADARGNWVAAPQKRKKAVTGRSGTPVGSTYGVSGGASGGYQGFSDADIDARANAYADSAIAAKQAAIERQRASAMAAAQRDAATYQALGGAQMEMIG